MENLSASQPVGFFQILRRDDLMRQNQRRQVRSILRERLHHRIAERLALLFPIAFKLVRRILHVNRHHVLALGRKRRISQRRNRSLQIRLLREVPILRFVERPLQIIDLVPNMNASLQRRLLPFLRAVNAAAQKAPGSLSPPCPCRDNAEVAAQSPAKGVTDRPASTAFASDRHSK